MTDAARPLRPEELLAETEWLRALAAHLVRDPGAADDVAQDAALAALRRPPSGERRPWLAQVARNFARQRFRSESRRARREEAAVRRGAEPSPEEIVSRVETHRLLAELVAALSEPNRTSLVMRYYEGLEPTQIAARLSVPPGTVRARIHRGLAELRERLDERHRGDRDAWLAALAPLTDGPRPPRAAPWLVPAAAAGIAVIAWLASTDATTSPPRAGGVAVAQREPAPRRTGPAVAASESPAAPEPAAPHVRGRIVGPDGRAVAGARVAWTQLPATPAGTPVAARLLADADTAATAATRTVAAGEDGAFDVGLVAGGRVRLVGSAPGLASAPVEVDAARDVAGIELRLEAVVRLRGRVMDEAAVPIAGAHVALVELPAPWTRLPPVLRSAAATDAAGTFALEAGGHLPLAGTDEQRGLLVSKDGFAPVFVLPGTPDDAVGIVLPRGGEIAGHVTAADGSPAARAVVSVEPRDRGVGALAVPLSAVCGGDGRFRVGPVGASSRFEFDLRVTTADGRSVVERGRTFPTAGPIELRLPTARTVRGRAVSADDGTAVAGVTIAAQTSQWGADAPWPRTGDAGASVAEASSPTGSDGGFEFPVPAGVRTSVRFHASGPVWGVSWTQRATEFDPAQPAPAEPVEVKLVRLFAVEGDVADADGRPAAGIPVFVSADPVYEGQTTGAVTGPDGRFRLTGVEPWQSERWVVTHADGRLDGAGGPIAASSTTDLSGVHVVLPGAGVTIRGRVEDERGRPVEGAIVTNCSVTPYGHAMSGADGTFSFDGIRPGGIALRAQRPGFPSFAYREVRQIPQGGDVGALRLETTSMLRGVVVDDAGAPVAAARVALAPEGQGNERLTATDAAGAFEFGGVTPLEQHLWIESAPISYVQEPVKLAPPFADPVRVVLRRALTIDGRIVDADGSAAAGVSVEAVRETEPDEPGGRAFAKSDGSGAFSLTGIGAGDYSLRLTNATAVHEPVPAGTTGLVWSLAPARTISGTVVDAEGRAAASQRVALFRDGVVAGRGPGSDVTSTVTDANGRFEIPGYRNGTYTLFVPHPALACEPARGVRPGDTGVELRLSAGLRISGVVVDADGNAVAGARAGASCTSGLPVSRNAQCDGEGRFAVSGLIAGEYRVFGNVVREGPPRVVLVGTAEHVHAGADGVRVVVAPPKR